MKLNWTSQTTLSNATCTKKNLFQRQPVFTNPVWATWKIKKSNSPVSRTHPDLQKQVHGNRTIAPRSGRRRLLRGDRESRGSRRERLRRGRLRGLGAARAARTARRDATGPRLHSGPTPRIPLTPRRLAIGRRAASLTSPATMTAPPPARGGGGGDGAWAETNRIWNKVVVREERIERYRSALPKQFLHGAKILQHSSEAFLQYCFSDHVELTLKQV